MQAEADTSEGMAAPRYSWLWRFLMLTVIALLVTGVAAWLARERIAGNLIDSALEDAGLEASYDIVSIGTREQVIENLVIGDPAAPDFTAERVVAYVDYGFAAPYIGRIALTRPRLYGSYRDGTLSFGSLDPLIFAESDAPPGLPEYDIAVFDGRALIESDYGRVGVKLDGAGRLDDGFKGILAATAPQVGSEDCTAQKATLYGNLESEGGRLGFDGPIRVSGLDCAGTTLTRADIAARLSLSDDFSFITGDLGLDAADFAQGEFGLEELTGSANIAWAFDGELSVRHELAGAGFSSPFANVGEIDAEGTLRSTGGLERAEWNLDLAARSIDADTDALALADARAASEGSFVAPLLAKFERGLSRSLAGAEARASVTVRADGGNVRAIIPEARLRSASGETVAALSRVSFSGATSQRAQRITGNFLTGGADLPRLNGRIEQVAGGEIALRMTMAEYREGRDAVAIPRLDVRQDSRGRVRFNGLVQAEGAIPGGEMRGLTLPLEGTWSAASGLAIGRQCTGIELRSLRLANLTLAGRRFTLCPDSGGAIARYTDRFQLGARTDNLVLMGDLGGEPTRITAESAVLRYPGPFRVEMLDARIGQEGSAVRLSAQTLEGSFDEVIGGRFEGGTAALDVVPLDLAEIAGRWDYTDDVLTIADGTFMLSERPDPANGPFARFEPLRAQDATLTLEDGVIRALASLRHPRSGSMVTDVTLRHDLSSGAGRADIDVPGVRFTENFQPEDLSYLAKGVIAFADGTITGEGEVTWTSDTVDSSGVFSTDSFDFAAAFGPVRDVSGTITFTDLLGLTTAPGQTLRIGSLNTGIEVLDGRIVYAIKDGTLISVADAQWPFMGGQLILQPVTLDYGGGQGQSYVFELIGLDAATFVAQMELTNLGAEGTFDGTIPIVFDAEGNGAIVGGLLISRPPGGNVAYVGELSYEDLGAMGNYAFQTLRSLDFNQMSVELNGSLAGEIITNFQIDGVRQGAGTSQNFVTRQLAKVPIRFKINVRSENFFLLSKVVRGFFDPTIFDREDIRQGLGIGGFEPLVSQPDEPALPLPLPPKGADDAQRRDESTVQPPESDEMP